MKPEESNFDDAIRKKISGFAETPPEDLWNRIEERRKRKFGFWLGFMYGYGFILLCLGLIGSIGFWYFSTDSGLKKETMIQTGNSSSDTSMVTGAKSQMVPLAGNQHTLEINQSNNPENLKTKSNHKTFTSTRSSSTLSHSPETKPVADHTKEKSTGKPATGESANGQQKTIAETPSQEIATKNGSTDDAAVQGRIEHIKEADTNNKAVENAHEIILSQLLIAEISPDELLPMQEKMAEKTPADIQTSQQGDSASGLSTTADTILANNLTETKDSSIVILQEDTSVIKSDSAGRKNFSIELTFSPDFVTKKMSANPEYEDFIEKRNATESLKNAWSVNLGLTYHLSKNFEIGTGLQYSMINESFHYEYREETIQPTIDTIKGMIVFPFSAPQPYTYLVPGSDTIQTTKYANETNSYQFISMPVTVTYTINKGKFGFGLMAGALVNLSFVQKGKILAADLNSETNLDDKSQNPFKNQAGLSIQGGIVGEYHLSEKLDIVIRPVYQYMLNSITESSYQVKQYYHTFSIRTGIKYNF